MPDDRDVPEGAAGHWGTRDPAAEPDHALVAGVGRLVLEARGRLGARATPAEVRRELAAQGAEVTEEQVRAMWDRDGATG